MIRKADEDWTDHLSRLERHHTSGKREDLHYRVVTRITFLRLGKTRSGFPGRERHAIDIDSPDHKYKPTNRHFWSGVFPMDERRQTPV
jgi:hypothetical protein